MAFRHTLMWQWRPRHMGFTNGQISQIENGLLPRFYMMRIWHPAPPWPSHLLRPTPHPAQLPPCSKNRDCQIAITRESQPNSEEIFINSYPYIACRKLFPLCSSLQHTYLTRTTQFNPIHLSTEGTQPVCNELRCGGGEDHSARETQLQ